MRISPSIFLLTAAAWLCTAVSAGASEPRTVFGHRAPRLGAVARSIAQRAGLADVSARIVPGSETAAQDDVAIQDDAPAARIDADHADPALEPLERLVSSRTFLPGHRILSRRSPRGPPLA